MDFENQNFPPPHIEALKLSVKNYTRLKVHFKSYFVVH